MLVKLVSVAASLGGLDTVDNLRDPGKKPANFNRFLSLRDRSRSVSTSGGRSVFRPSRGEWRGTRIPLVVRALDWRVMLSSSLWRLMKLR